MQIYNKLVRDKIPEIIKNDGRTPVLYLADKADYEQALLKKLAEEAEEFIETPCIEEIADIYEVLDALVKHFDYDIEEIKRVKREKQNLRGGFDKGIILKCVK